MRRNGLGLSAGIVCLVLAAFAVLGSACPAGERQSVLHVYTWSDYFEPEVIVAFEKQFNCRVAIDYFDSNEAMYAKLKAGGGGYDIITPSSYMSAVMDRQGMIIDLDHAKVPNIQYIDKTFVQYTEDPELRYSIPYTRTISGVGYNTKRVKESDLGSWDIFNNPAYAKRMTMLNDMRETIGAALKYCGYSLNTTDENELAKAGEVIRQWKKNLAKFDVDEAKIGLGSGEFTVIHGYNGDVALIMDENPNVSFYIPKEGSSFSADDFVIVTGSPQIDLAHAFINYLLDPEVAVKNMEGIRYFMPNTKAVEMLDDDLKNNPAFNVPDEVLVDCEVIRDLGENNYKYIKVWDQIKAQE